MGFNYDTMQVPFAVRSDTEIYDNCTLETFTTDELRALFVTQCFENGIDTKVVQSYLGHASLKMTMDLYTHVSEEKSSLDIEKIVPGRSNNVIEIRSKMA